jgi:uncharacterized membrane protein
VVSRVALTGRLGPTFSVAVGIVLAAYPLLVYAAMGRFGPAGAAVLLGAVCLARLAFFTVRGAGGVAGNGIALVCLGGALLAAAGFWFESRSAVLYYPVLVNAILLAVFAASLWRPPTVIERIARLREPDLPPAAIVYTRRVTIVWSVFFALNGAAALYTTVATSFEIWTLYNGFICYLLIGALFLGELATRSAFRARLKA